MHFLACSERINYYFLIFENIFFNPTKQDIVLVLLVGYMLPYYPGISVDVFEVLGFDV